MLVPIWVQVEWSGERLQPSLNAIDTEPCKTDQDSLRLQVFLRSQTEQLQSLRHATIIRLKPNEETSEWLHHLKTFWQEIHWTERYEIHDCPVAHPKNKSWQQNLEQILNILYLIKDTCKMSKLQKGRGMQLQSLRHTTIIGLKPNEETSEIRMAVPSEKHFDKWFIALRSMRSLAVTKNLTTKPWLDSQHIVFHYIYTRHWNCKKAEENSFRVQATQQQQQ